MRFHARLWRFGFVGLKQAEGFFLGDFGEVAVGAAFVGVGGGFFVGRWRGEAGEGVEAVDELAEFGEGAAVEFEDDAGVIGDEGFFVDDLGFAGFNLSSGADGGEVEIELLEFGGRGGVFDAEEELVADVAAGVVVAVKSFDVAEGVFGVLGDVVEVGVVGRNEAGAEEFGFDEAVPGAPVRAAGLFDEDDGERIAAAGLDEGEDFEAFIMGAEAAREEGDGVGFLDEDELAGKKVAEVDELGITFDDGIGALFEGEFDGDAEGVGFAGAFVAGSHDAATGTGDDHEARVGEEFGEGGGELVIRVLGRGAGAAEDGDFAALAVGLEDFEGVAEFFEGADHQFHFAAAGIIVGEFEDGVEHFGGKFAVGRDAGVVEEEVIWSWRSLSEGRGTAVLCVRQCREVKLTELWGEIKGRWGKSGR